MKNKGIFVNDPHATDKNGIRKDNPVLVIKDKFTQIFNYAREYNADIFIEGDLTDKNENSNEAMAEIMTLIKENKDINIYFIYGNHDHFQNNQDFIKRTSLNLLNVGCDNLINLATIEHKYVLGVDFLDTQKLFVPELEIKQKIVMAHSYYNQELFEGKGDNISPEQAEILEKKGVKLLLLGHDHEPHPTEQIGELKIFRIGNMYRKARKAYNYDRQVQVQLVDFESLESKLLPIEHDSFIDVLQTTKLIEMNYEEIDDKDISSLSKTMKETKREENFDVFLKKQFENESDKVKEKARSLGYEI